MKIPVNTPRHSALRLVSSVFAAGLTISPATAALFIYEGFNYSASTDLTTQNGGTGFGGAWGGDAVFDITTAGLSYGALQTSGLAVTAARGTSNRTIFRTLSSTLGGSGQSVWLSFLFEAPAQTTGLSLFTGTGDERTFSGAVNSGIGHRLYAGTGDPVSGSVFNPASQAFAAGTHMLVLHFDMTGPTPVHSGWVDPDSSSLGTGTVPTGGTSFTLSTDTQAFDFDTIRLGMFGGSSTVKFDEIRIEDSWALVSPVPEPSTTLLGCFGLLALLRRRR